MPNTFPISHLILALLVCLPILTAAQPATETDPIAAGDLVSLESLQAQLGPGHPSPPSQPPRNTRGFKRSET